MERENIFQIAYQALENRYREEDLFTDCFGAFLNLDRQAARSWFEWLTGIMPKEVKITTQPPLPDFPKDAPDMLIEASEMVLICEHKLGSGLGGSQLERYLQLAREQQVRTRVPHRLVLVAKERINVPPSILIDEHYCHPESTGHFLWQDVYQMLAQLPDEQQELSMEGKLRQQFMAYLRSLHMAPIKIPKGCPPLSGDYSPEEKEQQRAFGEAWWHARDWLEQEKGYRTSKNSRIAFDVWTTPFSEIPNHSGIHHLTIEPSEGEHLPPEATFQPPVLEFNISLDSGFDEVEKRILANRRSNLAFLALPLAVRRQKQSTGRIRISYAVPLNPLFEYADIREALYKVLEELYTQILLPSISS